MKPLVKYSAIAAAVAVLLIAAVAIVLYSVVDTEFIKKEAVKAAKEHTGRDLVFKGDVGLSVFPWLGVELGPVTLSNAPGFGDAPMAEINRTDIKVKVMPLFSGQVMVKSVIVDGLKLNLGRDEKGVTNFDDIVKRAEPAGEAAPAPAPEQDATQPAGDAKSALALAVGGVNFTNAALTWDDRQAGKRYSVSELNLTTGALAMGHPFDVAMSAKAEASDPKLSGSMDLKTRADLGKDFKTPSFKGLKLTIDADGGMIPGAPVEATIAGDIIIDLNASTVTVEGLALSAYDLTAKGGVKVAKFDTAPVVDATLAFDQFDPKKLMARLGLDPVRTTDPAALTKASVSLTARATQSSATVSSLKLNLDDTTLTGKAAVKNFERPAITFDLAANEIDVDRYLPPEDDKAGAGDKADSDKTPAPAGDEESKDAKGGLPKEELRKLDVDGTVKLGKLKAYNVRATDMQVTVKAKDGVIRITPLSAGLYGGILKTMFTTDLRGDAAKTKLDLGIAKMALGGLLTDAMGEDKITGTTALNITLAAVGEEMKPILKTLTGTLSLGLKNGVFKGVQVIPEAVREQAAASDPQKRVEKVEKQQKFKDISATFDIKNGLMTTKDTSLDAGALQGLGKGSIDLAKQMIDYKAVVDVTAMPKIPFTIKGPLTDPSVSLDKAEFVKGLAQGVVNIPVKVGKGVLDTGKGALEGIGQGLKGLFGGGSKSKDNKE